MASLRLSDGTILNDLEKIRSALSPLKVELSHWPVERSEKLTALLAAASLQDEQKESLLKLLDNRFEEQKKSYGYQTRDLVVLHPDVPKIDEFLSVFNRCHTHSDDEVRYIVDGSGIFGFVMPDGKQVQLTVEAQEYIRVPAHTEHWFVLSPAKRIKAVRYFSNKEGWVANYTGTPVHA
jgi:1,2-dihydroxy-3-keto-5-methylthiopentene dioxygenase